jgi:hypothetical protein
MDYRRILSPLYHGRSGMNPSLQNVAFSHLAKNARGLLPSDGLFFRAFSSVTPVWPKTILFGQTGAAVKKWAKKRASRTVKSRKVFGHLV